MRDPRMGLAGVSAGVGMLSALFLGMIGGHWFPIPASMFVLSGLLMLNMSGGPLRKPLAIVVAIILGLLSLPLIFTIGSITLIGAILALLVVFYREHDAMPDWLVTRRERRRRVPSSPAAGATGSPERDA